MRSLHPAPLLLLIVVSTACAGRNRPASAPAALPAEATVLLPPVPRVTGPLAVRVVYPRPRAVINARDSNFIFGSTGHGDAVLTVNGSRVPVLPNGSWLAWLPVPPADAPSYTIVATVGSDTARLEHPVSILPPRVVLAVPAPGPGPEPSLRVPAAAPTPAPRSPVPDELVRTRDSTAVEYVTLGLPAVTADTDAVVIGRPVAGGTYKYFFLPGTVVPVVAREGASVRVRLDSALDAWVASSDTRPVTVDEVPPARRVVPNVRVLPAAGWTDVRIPVASRPPYEVQQTERSIVLTLYGTIANTDIIQMHGADTLVRNVTWTQAANDRAVYTVHLSAAPYGYLVLWDSGRVVLRVRRPPPVSEVRPLEGIRIAVDPGHPPIGATGPTGLYEAVAVMAIGERLQRMLQERGAVVVMTRTGPEPVALGARPIIARRADAHAFVSIHLNALPDGVNPFTAHGTGTYYFHPQSLSLARFVQQGMVRRMGLRDLGVYYDNLAVVRQTWMPAVLCEGAFLMIPEQEAALRTPEFQERYARGVADGLEAYFRSLRAARE